MATVTRALGAGTSMGALAGAVVGTAIAVVQLIGLEGSELAASIVIYGAIGGIVGLVAGVVIGGALGLVVGIVLSLLLGPADQVPRRAEQLPIARSIGAAVGMLPLVALPIVGDWWPAAVMVSLVAAVLIAKRVPKIVGLTSLIVSSPKPQRSSR